MPALTIRLAAAGLLALCLVNRLPAQAADDKAAAATLDNAKRAYQLGSEM